MSNLPDRQVRGRKQTFGCHILGLIEQLSVGETVMGKPTLQSAAANACDLRSVLDIERTLAEIRANDLAEGSGEIPGGLVAAKHPLGLMDRHRTAVLNRQPEHGFRYGYYRARLLALDAGASKRFPVLDVLGFWTEHLYFGRLPGWTER